MVQTVQSNVSPTAFTNVKLNLKALNVGRHFYHTEAKFVFKCPTRNYWNHDDESQIADMK